MYNFSINEWVDYLAHRYPKEIDLGLTRMRAALEKFNIERFTVPVVTVAGTNGKGSTVASLSAIYMHAGYKVAAYTSPHLLKFNERICVNNIPVDDDSLSAILAHLEEWRGDLPLTFFEMTTLAALIYFQRVKPDVVILEVGLGGRLDATNVIDADLAIITTIALDHQEYLGDTRELIGAEKAGILRAHNPLIFASANMPESISQIAKNLSVPVYRLGFEYDYTLTDDALMIAPDILPKPHINANSFAAAVIASRLLQHKLAVSSSALMAAARAVSIPGRLEVCMAPVQTVLDVAHNPEATALLAKFVEALLRNRASSSAPAVKTHMVFGAMHDKDLRGILSAIEHVADVWYLAPLPYPRSATLEHLREVFVRVTEPAHFFPSPENAYQAALQNADAHDIIVVFGSFLTVAAVKQLLQNMI